MQKNLFHNENIQKHFFVGITLASAPTTDTGVAVLDKNLNIITLDKLYSMNDIKFFIDSFPGKQNAVFMVSIPDCPVMLNSKWKILSRPYQLVKTNRLMKNRNDWCERFSNRGADYFKQLQESGIDIFRFDARELKTSLGLMSAYKEHTPIDCKHLQNALRVNFKMRELPNNMIPIAQLEGILGAYLAALMTNGELNHDYKILFDFLGLDVIGT